MTTSENKKRTTVYAQAKTVYPGLYTYSKGLLKPENGLLKYGNNRYFRGVRKKKFHSKILKFVTGKKWRMKTNLLRGSPNIFSESAM